MSDLSDFTSSLEGAGEDPNKSKLSDLDHFMSTVGYRALHAVPDIIGFAGDLGVDAINVAKNAVNKRLGNDNPQAPVTLPGMGPVTGAVTQNFDTHALSGLAKEGINEADVTPKTDLERFISSAAEGMGAGMFVGPEAAAKSALGGAIGGITGEGAYKLTGNPYAAYFAGMAGASLPFLRGAGVPHGVRAGAAHPEYAYLVDNVIPRLEGGGTLDNPLTSPKGARGPMQVMPETAADPGHGIKPSNGTPKDDVRVGKQLFAALLDKYDGDTSKALAAYNWGEGHVDGAIAQHGDSWLAHAPDETRKYVNNGMALTYGGNLQVNGSVGEEVSPMNLPDIQDTRKPIAPDTGELVKPTETDNVAQFTGEYIEPGLRQFAKDLHNDVEQRASEAKDAGEALHNDGTLPFKVGDQFSTAKSREQGQEPWTVTGYFTDPKDPNRFGYRVTRGTGEDHEASTMIVSDPAADARIQQHIPNFDRAADVASWENLTSKPAEVVSLAKYRQDVSDARNMADVHRALDEADDIHEAISNKDWEVLPSVTELWESRQSWANYLEKLNRERLTRDPVDLEHVQELVNSIDDAISRLQDPSANKMDVASSADRFVQKGAKERKTPINDTSEADALDREGLYGGQPELPLEGGGGEMPPRQPPFGGGGEPPSEPPSGPHEPTGDKYAGSINLNRLAISDAAKENIKIMAAPMNMDIETFNETRQRANELIDKHGVEDLLNMESVKPKDLAAYATAVRAIHAAAQEHMLKLNEAFLDPTRNSEAAHIQWLHARDILAAAHERAQLIAKGLGRGLGALRIEVGGLEGDLGEKVADLMKSRASDEEVARMIQEHPEQASKIARDSKKPGLNEVIFTTWYAMLLSSLKTLSKNVLSNGIMNAMDTFVIHPTAAAIGLFHDGEKMTFRASLAGMGGLATGAIEGLKNAPEAYRRGAPSDFAERTQTYWKPQNKGLGRVISAPMRVLSAQDQVFLDAAQNAEYFRMAHVKAAAEGLSGEDYKARVQDLIENPTPSMEKQAVQYAQMMRFQDPMAFKGLEYATRSTPKDPVMIKIMKGFLRVLFPFPRNSDRMFFAAMRNSPLGVLEPKNLADFRAGGAKRDVAMARVLVGTGVAMGVYLWAANGGITGANPSDPSKKFMINFPGGVHISYQGLADPFSTTIGAIATAVEDAKTGTEDFYSKAFKGTKDLLGVLMSSTWATGAQQFFEATDDQTGKTMQAWIGRMASSFTTPALVREINQDYIDPTVRSTKQNPISDTVKAGLPGLSQTLPARHDAFGDKIVRENPLYLNAINPARVQIDKHPGLSRDLSKVETATPLLSKAPTSVTIDGVKHKLSAKGQEKYQAVSGRIFKDMMETNRFQLQGLPNEEKVKLVRKTLSDARKQARQELWGV